MLRIAEVGVVAQPLASGMPESTRDVLRRTNGQASANPLSVSPASAIGGAGSSIECRSSR